MSDRKQRLRRGATTVGCMATAPWCVARGLAAGCGGNNNEQNTLHPAGPAAHTILNLFSPFFWIAVVIGVGVLSATIYPGAPVPRAPGERTQPGADPRQRMLEISVDDHPVR